MVRLRGELLFDDNNNDTNERLDMPDSEFSCGTKCRDKESLEIW